MYNILHKNVVSDTVLLIPSANEPSHWLTLTNLYLFIYQFIFYQFIYLFIIIHLVLANIY